MFRRFSFVVFLVFFLVSSALAGDINGTVRFSFDLNAPENAKSVRLWMPYPVSDETQTIRDLAVNGNYSDSAVYREDSSEALYLFAGWDGAEDNRRIMVSFNVTGREARNPDLKDTGAPVPVHARRFLEPSHWIPTDGKVGKLAREITKGKKGILEKSRAVYEWVVANTYRDPSINGCGLGDVEVTLAKRGGKCADISSVYVALARAAGVPARDVFGIRVGSGERKDITKGFHCWAEFYLPGTGWVPVDPADVRKLMLKKDLDIQTARPQIDYYFGSLDRDHIALSRAERGITFVPAQAGGPLSYFLYPYAEANGTPLDHFDPKAFGYEITFIPGASD